MIKRESYLKQIEPFIGCDLIKVITGIRRCGKSVILQLVREKLLDSGIKAKQIISFNFEDMQYNSLCTAEALHQEILRLTQNLKGKVYLFFDEIQEVKDWEKCLSSLRVKLDCDIYITGSNAKLLSGELATRLAGRYVEFTIYPFSFSEFRSLYLLSHPQTNDSKCFHQYLTLGGMPFLHNLNYEESPCRQYLLDLFDSVQLKDIAKRYSVRDVDLLSRLIEYVIQNTGMTFLATSLAKFFKSEQRKVSVETLLNYLKYCTDAFLFHPVKQQNLKGKQLLVSNQKYYIADHGMRDTLFHSNAQDIHQTLENIVYMELRRRSYSVTVGKAGEKEIDFVCEKDGQRLYVQVCYLLASEETVQREFGAYDLVRDNFPKYVLSLDEIDFSRNGIKHLNIRDFLLDLQGI